MNGSRNIPPKKTKEDRLSEYASVYLQYEYICNSAACINQSSWRLGTVFWHVLTLGEQHHHDFGTMVLLRPYCRDLWQHGMVELKLPCWGNSRVGENNNWISCCSVNMKLATFILLCRLTLALPWWPCIVKNKPTRMNNGIAFTKK